VPDTVVAARLRVTSRLRGVTLAAFAAMAA